MPNLRSMMAQGLMWLVVSVYSEQEQLMDNPTGQIENADVSISRIFFSDFYKSLFSIFTNSEYRKLGFQKSKIFTHLSSEYRKLGFQKIDIH